MLPPLTVTAGPAPHPPLRMRDLLLSWALLTTVWVIVSLLVEVLVLRRVALTAAQLWTALLVPACQALALEALAAPLRLGAAVARLRASLGAPATLAIWLLSAAAVAGATLWGEGKRILAATGGGLLLLAAALVVLAVRRTAELRAARGSALRFAVALVVVAANVAEPWLDRLPALVAPQAPPGALRVLFVLLLVGFLYSTLFRFQRALGTFRETAADWLGVGAGCAAVGLVASALPFRLTVGSPGSEPLAPAILGVAAAASAAAAGAELWRRRAET